MSLGRTLFFYVARLYTELFLGIYLAILVIFLIVDYGDRSKAFGGHPIGDVLLLYANKAPLAAQQLGPAAMLLAGAAAVSTLRKRGELTAMKALAFPAAALYLPIGLCAIAASGLLVAFDEAVVTRAGARVDEISHERFNFWGDRRFYHSQARWFRVGDRVFHLRAGDWERGFEDVTLLRLSPELRLVERIDAARMTHRAGTLWELAGVADRVFLPDGSSRLETRERQLLDIGVEQRSFRIRLGRPEQMRAGELIEQISARALVGLPTPRHLFALHQRFAYPLTGFAAAMLAIGLVLRPGRKGHLSAALVEGLVIAMVLWGLLVIGKALVLAGHLPAPVAAWAPFSVLTMAAAVLWLRREGALGKGGI